MTYNSESQVYYYKFLELQEKLRRSEEDRLKLEIKLNEMIQRNREEEQQYYQSLKSEYKDFLKYDTHRMLRNEQILQALDKIEMKISLLSAKTERFKVLRQHYQAYLDRINSTVHGKPILHNIPGFPGEKRLSEKEKLSSTSNIPEEMKISDSYNHNYVYNYLKKKSQSKNVQQKPHSIFQFNSPGNFISGDEILPPLHSFTHDNVNSSKIPSISSDIHQGSQNVEFKQNLLNYKERAPPHLSAHDQSHSYMNSRIYNNQPTIKLDTQSSNFNFSSGCGDTFQTKRFSTDEELKVNTPEVHIGDIDYLGNNIYPNTHEEQSKTIRFRNDNNDNQNNAGLASSQNPETYEYNKSDACDKRTPSSHQVKDNFVQETLAKDIVVSDYNRENGTNQEQLVHSEISKLSTEPRSSKIQLNPNEIVKNLPTEEQSKSTENYDHVQSCNINLQNVPDGTIVTEQKPSDCQSVANLEKINTVNDVVLSEVESNVIYTEDIGNSPKQEISIIQDESNSGNTSNEGDVLKTPTPLNVNDDFDSESVLDTNIQKSEVENINQNKADALSRNELKNLSKETCEESGQNKLEDTSEVINVLEEPVVDSHVQKSEHQLENQGYNDESYNLLVGNHNNDQFHDNNNDQYLSEDPYPQYVKSGEHSDNGSTEVIDYENPQGLPTAFEEQVQDETVRNIHSNIQYEEDQQNNYKENENITGTTQNFDPNNDFQAYVDNNGQYLHSDQYPQYGQNQEVLNYDQSVAQNFNENDQQYNMQYDEKDLSYMQYDVNNQEYNQQYYENNENYANYEHQGENYDQTHYNPYNQEGYAPEQQPVYEGHEQEHLNENVAPPDALYSEVDNNGEGFCQDVAEVENVSNVENNDTKNLTNLVNILETDSEMTTDVSDVKVSNESDFDFSSNQ